MDDAETKDVVPKRTFIDRQTHVKRRVVEICGYISRSNTHFTDEVLAELQDRVTEYQRLQVSENLSIRMK